MRNNWKFISHEGDFSLTDPYKSSYLHFPLANESGMMSSISPALPKDSLRTDALIKELTV